MIDKLSLIAVYPELLLFIMACVIAMFDLGVKGKSRTPTYMLALFSLAAVTGLLVSYAMTGQTIYGFDNMVVNDAMGNWLKAAAALAVMVTLVYGRAYAMDREMMRGGELFTMSLFALLGMFVMISGNNFLVIYMGIELLTLSSYALVALRRDHSVAVEAAMKYFVLGALASGFLLYGMSMLYGATGSLNLHEVFAAINTGKVDHRILVFGLVFIVAGLAFKLGVVPFHMWIPDVYQGAPTVVTLLVGGAPKLAAFAVFIRILVEGLLPLAVDWQQMLMFLAIASLAIGNFAAIAQTNIKRMLAFSTISHMGFVLIGLMSGVLNGQTQAAGGAYGAAMFYVVSYVLTTLASFGVILLLSRRGYESEEISDFAGLNQRSPFYAGIMAMCLFSLAGIPPMVGFYAKLAVLQALLSSGGTMAVALAIFAVMMSLVGAFYYLRVVKVMYFDAPVATTPAVSAAMDVRVVLTLNGGLLLLLGLVPGGLMTLCAGAVAKMLTS